MDMGMCQMYLASRYLRLVQIIEASETPFKALEGIMWRIQFICDEPSECASNRDRMTLLKLPAVPLNTRAITISGLHPLPHRAVEE